MRVSGATRSGRSRFRYVQPYYPKWAFPVPVCAAILRSGRSQFRYVQPYYPKWAFLNANATLSGPATWHLFADDRVVRPGDGLGSAACLAATPRNTLGASAAKLRALERCRRCKQTLGQAAEADRCAIRTDYSAWRSTVNIRLLVPRMVGALRMDEERACPLRYSEYMHGAAPPPAQRPVL